MSHQTACKIRTYRDGDEERLVELFSRAYETHVGFVPRTVGYWLWCCKTRPGVGKEGILVAEMAGEIAGYAVVTDSGDILEFCYDPQRAGEQIVPELLQAVEDYLKNLGVGSVTLNASEDDDSIRKACVKLGYVESPLPYSFQLNVLDLPRLLRAILPSKLKDRKDPLNGKILLKVKRSSMAGLDHITVTMSNSSVQVAEEKTNDPDFVVETDQQSLTSCILGSMKPEIGVLTGKAKISPFWKAAKAVAFLSMLKLDGPWYVPLGDYG